MSSSRRTFLKAAAGTTIATLAAPPVFAAERDNRPNILFCIADDWGFGHASIYGDKAVRTPTFDRIARDGALFTRSFCIAPTCTASRGGILTGQPPHRLEAGANLWSILPAKFQCYTDLLEKSGYTIGLTGKGLGPGGLGERTRNAAGPNFRNFDAFLKTVPGDKPFCYWFGSSDPHRAYDPKLKEQFGLRRADVVVPAFLPDTPEVRDDILDYYAEVQRFDNQVAQILKSLEQSGRAENTIVVITSDNGMPFPHSKANLYEPGIHMPLAIRFPGRVKPGQKIDALVSHLDFAPTFLELAGLKAATEMAGRSLMDLFGADPAARPFVFAERERHAQARDGNVGYPCRAIRTPTHLYIRNFRPERWPAGDPTLSFSQGTFSDIDRGPTKEQLLARRDEPAFAPFFHLACDKRPAEELYDVVADPACMKNMAQESAVAQIKQTLAAQLQKWMSDSADPRASGGGDEFDKYHYVTR